MAFQVDLYQNTLVLAGLAVVQATNLSAWMDALVSESAVFSSQLNATYELSLCFNTSLVNVTTTTQCDVTGAGDRLRPHLKYRVTLSTDR